MADSVISYTSKNAMEDDSAAFSFVLSGDVYWDKVLSPNDAIVLKMYPDAKGKAPQNPVLLVGMISEVRLEGDYGSNSKMYRITGQSFAKAFMQFDLGVIQEVSVVLTDIGWLPDDNAEGTTFTQKNASQIAEAMIERFIQYMKYSYVNGYSVEDFMEWELDSWTDFERLIDATPFINYEGSLKQLLDDITAKPFNEFYFEATAEEKCKAIMRRTPFDKEDWDELPIHLVDSHTVVTESVAFSDTEAYAIFNVTSGNILGIDSTDLMSFPQYHQALIDKYGYRKLELDNRYLMTASVVGEGSESPSEDDEEEDDTNTSEDTTRARTASKTASTKTMTVEFFINYVQQYSLDRLRVNRSSIAATLGGLKKGVTTAQAEQLINIYISKKDITQKEFSDVTGIVDDHPDSTGSVKPTYSSVKKFMESNYKNSTLSDLETVKKGILGHFKNVSREQANLIAITYLDKKDFTKENYDVIFSTDGEATEDTASGASAGALKIFALKTYNWYCENANFYAGDIKVLGHPDYRMGNRLVISDEQNQEVWEYYIESVQHDFSYTTGYTTTLGVTRGLPQGGVDRFTHLWGESQDFKGGLLGELGLKDLIDEALKDQEGSGETGGESGSGGSTVPGSKVATTALAFGLKYEKKTGKQTVYSFGGGRGSNPFKGSEPYAMDCSSFIYWCYDSVGISLAGGNTGVTTWSILGDSRFEKISTQGGKNAGLLDTMKTGDIVFFYSDNGHVGIYAGGGKFVGCNGSGGWDTEGGIKLVDMTQGYWWDNFNGNVLRWK